MSRANTNTSVKKLYKETRAQVIIRYTQDYLRATGTKKATFADAVMRKYHDQVPPMLREIRFHTGGDTYADMKANAQIIRRFMEGDNRLPADLEESWVAALPDIWSLRLVSELAYRYGLLAVHMPQSASSHTGDLAKLMKETGEACTVTSRMLDDGRFTPDDMPLYKKAMDEIDDVLVAAIELKTRIQCEVAEHKISDLPNHNESFAATTKH